MKKIMILWVLAIGMANAQNIRIGVINTDTTTRPFTNLAALAWRNNNLYVVKPTGNTVKFLQNDSRLYVGDNNRVGIGTKAPSQAFEVVGNAKIGGSLQIGVGAGLIRSDANGVLATTTLTTADLPNLGSLYLPINGGGSINGDLSVKNISFTDGYHIHRLTENNGTLGLDYFWDPGGMIDPIEIHDVMTFVEGRVGFGTSTPDRNVDIRGFQALKYVDGNEGTDKFLRSDGFGVATWASLTKSLVGLGNVDNTSDANKPISTLTQNALNEKLNTSTAASTYMPFTGGTFTAKTNNVSTENTAYSASTAFQNGNNVGVVNQIYNNSNSTLSYSGLKLTTRSSLPTSWSILNVNAGLGLGDLVFGYGGSSSSSEIMRLNNSGNLGIGKLPQRRLDVGGDISNDGSAYLATNSGNVAIGSLTAAEKLDVTGNIKASGTILGSNISGTNTGDNAVNSLYSGLATSKLNVTGGNLTGIINNIVTENTAYSASTSFQNGNSVGVVNQIYNNSNSTLSYAGLKLTTRSSLPTSWSILNVNAGLGLGDLVFGYGGSSASTERMRLNNSGHLGIGKTPQRMLDVAGDISNDGNAYLATNSGNVAIGSLTAAEKLDVTGNIKASGTILGSNISGTNTGDNAVNSLYSGLATSKLNVTGGNLTGIINNIVTENTAYSASTAFQNGNSVGVVNQIYNNSNSTLSYAGLKLTTRSSLPTSWSILNVNAGLGLGDLVFGYGGSSASSELMRLNNSGFLGIGTSNPNVPLQVQKGNAGDEIARFLNTAGYGLRIIAQTGGTGTNSAISAASGESISINPNNTEAVRVLANGNVGIGRSPSEKLHVIGNILTNQKIGFNDDIGNYYIGSIPDGMQYSPYTVGNFTFTSGGGNWSFTNGKVGIGTTTPEQKLHIEGLIKIKAYTTTEINALTGMTVGTITMNSTISLPVFYNGTSWKRFDGTNM